MRWARSKTPAAFGHLADQKSFVDADGVEFFFVFFDEGLEAGTVFVEEDGVDGVQSMETAFRDEPSF